MLLCFCSAAICLPGSLCRRLRFCVMPLSPRFVSSSLAPLVFPATGAPRQGQPHCSSSSRLISPFCMRLRFHLPLSRTASLSFPSQSVASLRLPLPSPSSGSASGSGGHPCSRLASSVTSAAPVVLSCASSSLTRTSFLGLLHCLHRPISGGALPRIFSPFYSHRSFLATFFRVPGAHHTLFGTGRRAPFQSFPALLAVVVHAGVPTTQIVHRSLLN